MRPSNSTLPRHDVLRRYQSDFRRSRGRRRGFGTPTTLLVAMLWWMPIAFGGALLDNAPAVALGVLLFGIVAAFVLAVAWMRPRNASPEHHPAIDRLFDDTSP